MSISKISVRIDAPGRMLTGFDDAMHTSLGNLDIMADQVNDTADGINAILPDLESVPTVLSEVEAVATAVASNASLASSAAAMSTTKAAEAAASAVAAGTAKTGSEAARDVSVAAAERAQAAISGSVWTQPLLSDGSVAAVAYLTPTTLSVAGDETQLDNLPSRRAIKLTQTLAGTGYVAGAVYDADAGHVVVTVTGCAVDEGLSEVWLGQAPDNAPQQTDAPAGADLYLYQTCNGF